MSIIEELYKNEKENYEKRKEHLVNRFQATFSTKPDGIFSSCGRVELLGNHTDHNHGKALVASIDMDILAAALPTKDNCITFISEGYDEMKVSLDDIEKVENEQGTSTALIRGVLKGFKDRKYRAGGLKVYSTSNIWRGAGISSSAAFELLICEMLNYYYNNDKISLVELAKIGQFAESQYFGKPCGLLDQLGVALGGVNYIDFANIDNPKIENLFVNLSDYNMILVNTGGNHSELTSHYAQIKEDMLAVANLFNKPYLNELEYQEFSKNISNVYHKVGGRAALRAMHFYDENARVIKAFDALKSHNISEFLEQVNLSGESSYKYLQNCYVPGEKEQSIPLALTLFKKVIVGGASRIHGGGFAGTILVFVPLNQTEVFINSMHSLYGDNSAFIVHIRNKGSVHVETL